MFILKPNFMPITTGKYKMPAQLVDKQVEQGRSVSLVPDTQILQGLLNESDAIIWAKDLEGRYIHANANWFAKYGFNPQEHLGKTDFDLMPEDIAKLFVIADRTIQQTKEPQTYDFDAPLAVGNRFFRTKKFPIFDEAGEVIAIGGIQTDISETKSASDKLELIQGRQDLLREITLSGLMVLDLVPGSEGTEFLISDVNNYAGEAFGIRAEDMIGQRLNVVLSCHWSTKLDGVYRKITETGQNQSFDIQYRSGDLNLAVRANAGWTPRGMVVAFTMITDLLQTQENLRKLNQQVVLERARYIDQYRSAPALLYSTNMDRIVLDGSERFFEHFGYAREEMVGQHLSRFLTEETNEFALSDVVSDFIRDGYCSDVPYQFVAKTGEIRDVELSAIVAPIPIKEGSPNHLAVLNDVTERNAVQAELLRKNLELQKLNKSLGSFAYIASHDLQEPLRKIRQFSEVFLEDNWDRVDEDGQYMLTVISKSAQRMSKLISDLLAYSRTSNKVLVYSSINLGELVADVCGELELKIAETQADIRTNDLQIVEGDRPHLEQLFRNLIGNALKYRHPNRAPIITIRPCDALPACCFKVADNGIGFDSRYVDQIFQPFRRLHPSHDYEGSGIGLALCQTICNHHGWTISGEGQPGEGAIFSICLTGEHIPPPVA